MKDANYHEPYYLSNFDNTDLSDVKSYHVSPHTECLTPKT